MPETRPPSSARRARASLRWPLASMLTMPGSRSGHVTLDVSAGDRGAQARVEGPEGILIVGPRDVRGAEGQQGARLWYGRSASSLLEGCPEVIGVAARRQGSREDSPAGSGSAEGKDSVRFGEGPRDAHSPRGEAMSPRPRPPSLAGLSSRPSPRPVRRSPAWSLRSDGCSRPDPADIRPTPPSRRSSPARAERSEHPSERRPTDHQP